MKEHGKIGDGKWRHYRWCDVCGEYHGRLYNCKHYPSDIKAEIRDGQSVFNHNINIDRGIPEEVVFVNRVFAGKKWEFQLYVSMFINMKRRKRKSNKGRNRLKYRAEKKEQRRNKYVGKTKEN